MSALGLPIGEWVLPVLAWTRPDGGSVRRPPALVISHDEDGAVRLAPPHGWRDLDTFYAVEADVTDDRLDRMGLTIPGVLLGDGPGTTASWELVPADGHPVAVSAAGDGEFVGVIAGQQATGTWSLDPERGLRIEADRGGARSAFTWRTRCDEDEVVGLDVVIHHAVGEHVGGMQIRLG